MILANVTVDCNISLFDLVTIIITVLSVFATTIAVIISLRNTRFHTKVQYKSKNLEDKNSFISQKNNADIIFTNFSENDACIESIVCSVGSMHFNAVSVTLNNEPIKFPIILKPLNSIKIKSVQDNALFYFSANKRRFVRDKENTKLKFTLIDTQAKEHTVASKYKLNHYSSYSFFDKNLSQDFFDKLLIFIHNTQRACIYVGSTYGNCYLHIFENIDNFNEILSDLAVHIQQKEVIETDKNDIWTISILSKKQQAIYKFNDYQYFKEFLDYVSLLSDEISAYAFEKTDLENLINNYSKDGIRP